MVGIPAVAKRGTFIVSNEYARRGNKAREVRVETHVSMYVYRQSTLKNRSVYYLIRIICICHNFHMNLSSSAFYLYLSFKENGYKILWRIKKYRYLLSIYFITFISVTSNLVIFGCFKRVKNTFERFYQTHVECNIFLASQSLSSNLIKKFRDLPGIFTFKILNNFLRNFFNVIFCRINFSITK